MNIESFHKFQTETVVQFFFQTFSDSEGEREGKVIGGLVKELIGTTEPHDMSGFCASKGHDILGCIFFSRLWLSSDKPTFLLSPVAVSTQHQKQGIGQKLINYGLEDLRKNGVELVVTYGDPAFYSKVGFEKISESTITAPYTLSHPGGWLAQSLNSKGIAPEPGAARCVPAFKKPELW